MVVWQMLLCLTSSLHCSGYCAHAVILRDSCKAASHIACLSRRVRRVEAPQCLTVVWMCQGCLLLAVEVHSAFASGRGSGQHCIPGNPPPPPPPPRSEMLRQAVRARTLCTLKRMNLTGVLHQHQYYWCGLW